MDSIIGLLFVLLPVILGLVGKKLEKSGKGGTEILPKPHAMPVAPAPQHGEGVSSIRKQRSPRSAVQPAVSQQAAPYAVQEGKTVQKEKLDPKKLVIYSEIMKPKF
ncbi:MAG: hypothetical protein IKY48_03485 [Bacteroidales bacterium]|nr:hypothetical protein [Bacteroidales bacterium]